MSALITRAPSGIGRRSLRARLSRCSSCPASTTCLLTIELMFPVPPMNRIFMGGILLRAIVLSAVAVLVDGVPADLGGARIHRSVVVVAVVTPGEPLAVAVGAGAVLPAV